MFSFFRTKRFANLVIDDYVIRLVENSGQQLTKLKVKEIPLPAGLVENGKVIDELQFYEFMTDVVDEWKMKHAYVRFYVPDSLVIMRHVEFPAHLQGEEIIDYFMLEVGESIHFPFDDPLFDLHVVTDGEFSGDGEDYEQDQTTEMRKATLFAAPEEEVRKFTDLFDDLSLKPVVADVRSLGVYRFFHQIGLSKEDKTYLFFELNLTSVNISIFSEHQIGLLRYQQLGIAVENWSYQADADGKLLWQYRSDSEEMKRVIEEQIDELERMMNFYRYSLYKGQKKIDEIIVLGDHPHLAHVVRQIEQHYELPLNLLKAYTSQTKEEAIAQPFVPALGLALKGGE